jgi:hypothetical protein
MRISSAVLLLVVPATWAATIPVGDTVSGIVETAAVLTNPSIASIQDNSHISRDVSNTAEEIQSRDDGLEGLEALFASLEGLSTLSDGELENIIKEQLKELREAASKTLDEKGDEIRTRINELLLRIAGILNDHFGL